MQEHNFYELPTDTKIKEIKYVAEVGFTAFDTGRNNLFTIFTYDNGPDYESQGLIRIVENEKIGFANLKGEIIIPPQYDAALPFNDGLAAICEGCIKIKTGEHKELIEGLWGFIDKEGTLIIPPKYDKVIESFKNGVAQVESKKETLLINKKGAPIEAEEMNREEWIKIFGKASNLIVNISLNDDYKITNSYSVNGDYLFTNNTHYLTTTLFYKDKKLVEYDIIPWTDFLINQNENNSVALSLTKDLIVVTEYAVIYKTHQTAASSAEELNGIETFDNMLKAIMNVEALNKLQAEELSIPEDVQIISAKVYNYYVELEMAIPGSQLPEKDEWRKVCNDRMLHLHLVPDIGDIKTSWIKTETDIMNVYYKSVEDSLLAIFNNAIDEAITYPNNRNEIYEKSKIAIREQFNSANSYVNFLYDRYEQRLHKWLLLDFNEQPYPTEKKIFGDYEPKRTPDTLLDYAPELAEIFSKLPPANKENLTDLIFLFEQFKLEADQNPGTWEDGNIVLGANPKEYKPSNEELILNEIGNRIKSIVDKNIDQTDEEHKTLHYKNFTVTHVDVMGSGRFFYIEQIEEVYMEVAE